MNIVHNDGTANIPKHKSFSLQNCQEKGNINLLACM